MPPVFPAPLILIEELSALQAQYPSSSWGYYALGAARAKLEYLNTALDQLRAAHAEIEELRTKLEAAEIARDEAREDHARQIRKEEELRRYQHEAARRLVTALNAVDDHLRDARSAAIQLV